MMQTSLLTTDQHQHRNSPADQVSEACTQQWHRAIAGDPGARSEWRVAEGGNWSWSGDSLEVNGNGSEWSAMEWLRCDRRALEGLSNFVVEVTVSGERGYAGLSVGPYKDFLVELKPGAPGHRLQLRVDSSAGLWGLCVDGVYRERQWWDSAITGPADVRSGTVTFKARNHGRIYFSDLAIRACSSRCRLSVILTCYRFLQRLRVSLRNWMHQSLDFGDHELLIVNPGSPDGTHDYLQAVMQSYPHLRVREILAPGQRNTNKGAMINRALAVARGEWIWLTDSDCIFAPDACATVLSQIQGQTNTLFFGQRRYLSTVTTNSLLAGRVDGLSDFDALLRKGEARSPDCAPWGYTQIGHRTVFDRVRYREHLNHFAYSDLRFVEDCQRVQINVQQLHGLACLHLEHPFAWYGTNSFL
jgi:hypothetical protein